MANINIFGIIINKFGYKKKIYLIILLEMDRSLKVGFYWATLFFGLTVFLWIESGKEFLLNAKEIT